jgi:type I restriction enzyme R subunit
VPGTTSEATFESLIARHLVEKEGFLEGAPDDYDRGLCLIRDDVVDVVRGLQPARWEAWVRVAGGVAEATERLLRRVAHVVGEFGTVHALRKGIDIVGAPGGAFQLCAFEPANPVAATDAAANYHLNVFRVVRQVRYATDSAKSLDLVLFLNGLPVFTAELKNELTGQTWRDAVHQYRTTRDPNESLFALGRCLAHVALDSMEVHLTTHLQGKSTRFLPFNRGRDGGAGNVPSRTGHATSYLWEEVWTRRSILELVQRFVRKVDVYGEDGKRVANARRQLFPRYHQVQCVRALAADARAHGAGRRYLNQHSAGSGKTACIAWLASRLVTLHGDDGTPVFDSVIVISDRRVIDRQLQRELQQVIDTPGILEVIDGDRGATSQDLRRALQNGKKVIVSTLQKFDVIARSAGELPGTSFALIIDEAHSSQSGDAAKAIPKVLGGTSPATTGGTGDDCDDDETYEDVIAEELRRSGPQPNLSYFAFTATPKPQTLELFGTRRPDGTFGPYSLYPMRQAIEEGFILDVLRNYATYDQFWNLLKKVEGDPTFETPTARALLRQFVGQHEAMIEQKVRIAVDHFRSRVASGMAGEAKAMIVTGSRLQAVRYRQALDRYLAEVAPEMRALVAFTGTVKDPLTDAEYTEAGMNSTGGRVVNENQTADEFRKREYRFLVVASKFQTGFDQPKLVAMYVDRKLQGVTAVQTLSRLNRMAEGKPETFVLDFANEANTIREAFQPFYDRVHLQGETDANALFDIRTHLASREIYHDGEVEAFAKAWFAPKARATQRAKEKTVAACTAIIDRVVARWGQLDADDKEDARSRARDFVTLYAYVTQLVPVDDPSLAKLNAFLGLLVMKLPGRITELPVDIQRMVDLASLAVRPSHDGPIDLVRGDEEKVPITFGEGATAGDDPETAALSKIIADLNDQFGTTFGPGEIRVGQRVKDRIDADPVLRQQLQHGAPDAQREQFKAVVEDALEEEVESNFQFYRKVKDDQQFNRTFIDRVFDWFKSKRPAA